MSVDMKNLFSKKNAGLWIFLGAALLVAVLLAVFVAPWASSSPDGLEKVAGNKGFLNKAEEEKPAWEHSPMKDYAVPGVNSEKASTGISGFVGVLITAVVMIGVALLAVGLGKLRKRKTTVAPSDET